MEILQILTTGITGIVAACFFVFMTINALKAGWLWGLSKWVTSVDKVKDGGKYGGRILFLGIVFSIAINLIQAVAIGLPIEWAMLVLKVIGCSLMATGGYEYIKTIAKNIPHGGA